MSRGSTIAILATLLLPMLGTAGAAEVVVVQQNKTFTPNTLTIHRGDVVVFKNQDSVTHNAFAADSGFDFNLTAQKPGALDRVTFATEGTVEVRCAFHPAMRLTVVVTP